MISLVKNDNKTAAEDQPKVKDQWQPRLTHELIKSLGKILLQVGIKFSYIHPHVKYTYFEEMDCVATT